MSKYTSITTDIFSVFSSNDWLAESIKTFPDNFVGTSIGNEYIRVNMLFGENNPSNSLISVSGQLMIDIFTESGQGPNRFATIADKLDHYLVGKSFNLSNDGTTQLGSSNLQSFGIDKDNSSLHRALYTIPFDFYGV